MRCVLPALTRIKVKCVLSLKARGDVKSYRSGAIEESIDRIIVVSFVVDGAEGIARPNALASCSEHLCFGLSIRGHSGDSPMEVCRTFSKSRSAPNRGLFPRPGITAV